MYALLYGPLLRKNSFTAFKITYNIFAWRCYKLMYKRGLCRHMRCPSVCHVFVYSVETNTYISSIFSHHAVGSQFSHTILVFRHLTVWQYSDRDPLTVAIIATFDKCAYLAFASTSVGRSGVVNILIVEYSF